MDERTLQGVPLGKGQHLVLNHHRHPPMVVPLRPRTAADLLAFALLRLRRRRKSIPRIAATVIATVFGFAILMHLVTGRIFPNVHSMGVYIGSMTTDEASATLMNEWLSNLQIQLVDGERVWTARPHELGLSLDAETTAVIARRVGLAGIPFGYDVEPSIQVDGTILSQYIAALTDHVDVAPMNASYQWINGNVVGVPGHQGRQLDVEQTLETIFKVPAALAETRHLDLSVISVSPDVADPLVYIDQVRHLLSYPFTISGRDPFTSETINWTAKPEAIAGWLEATPSGLRIRESAFAPFVASINLTLATEDGWARYIDTAEAAAQINTALAAGQTSVQWRIRYKPGSYLVVSGDTASDIAEKTGIPLALLQLANPDQNLNLIRPGDVLNLPSRDITLPKR